MLSISNGHLYSGGCWQIAQCSWNGNTSSVLHVDSSNDDGIALYPETLGKLPACAKTVLIDLRDEEGDPNKFGIFEDV